MSIAFNDLPKHEKVYIIEKLGLAESEERLLYLKYVEGFSYHRIAAEMNLSPKSVLPLLTRVRKHAIKIANECYDMADDRCKMIIEKVYWADKHVENRFHNNLAK